jgi:uncharacterized protein (DUF433 family)/transposase
VSTTVSLLERPVYGYAEADRLLRVSPGTAQRWINGYKRAGVAYPPVVREKPTDSRWVTWGEFVEARLLAEFRQGIPMLKLRPVVEWLRNYTGEPYPLSYSRTFLEQDGRDLLLRAQVETDLDTHELWMVFPVAGQGALMTATTRRFTSVIHASADDARGAISALRADGGTPDVVLAPDIRQGQPSVGNIPTERLAEFVRAGDSIESVVDGYGLSEALVEQAVSYEATRRGVA